MRYIAHRGLFEGPDLEKENSPNQIMDALGNGFDVEVDLRYLDNNFFLGHDDSQYKISQDFLVKNIEKLWIHCKNSACLDVIASIKNANYFWHQEDDYTLTSKNFIWVYPGQPLPPNSVMVMPEWNANIDSLKLDSNLYGVCSDFVGKLRKANF